MGKAEEARLVAKPKFKSPKVKFNPKYFNKRMREIRHTLSKNGV